MAWLGISFAFSPSPPSTFGASTGGEPELAEADEFDRKKLGELAELLAAKKFRVQRFVRCACPGRGTLLAGENIDQFLSVLTNLVGLIPGLVGNPLYEVVKRVTLQIVKNRTEPDPRARRRSDDADLAAGRLSECSRRRGGWRTGVSWRAISRAAAGSTRLGVFLTDRLVYESRDNDLVVNTDSMFYGARRKDPPRYVFDQGADVSHFNYFKNERTRAALARWLISPDTDRPAEFLPIVGEMLKPVPMLRSMQTRAGAAQPIVFVLPGIMGSHLAGSRRPRLARLPRTGAAGGLGLCAGHRFEGRASGCV